MRPQDSQSSAHTPQVGAPGRRALADHPLRRGEECGGAQSPDAFPAWTGAAPAGSRSSQSRKAEQWAAGDSGVLGSGGRVEPAVGDCGKEDATQTSKINTVCQDLSQMP